MLRALPPVATIVFLASGVVLLVCPLLPGQDGWPMLLTVAAACAAFFSLSHLSRNFRWDQAAPRVVLLLGGVFLLGLVCLVLALPVQPSSRSQDGVPFRFVLLILGLYLSLFAAFAVQGVLGWMGHGLTLAGVLLLLAGGGLAYVGWEEYRVWREIGPQPQEIPLEELLSRGHGDNRHLRLTNFRFCQDHLPNRVTEGDRLRLVSTWVAVVPAESPTPVDEPFAAVPRRVRIVVEERTTEFRDVSSTADSRPAERESARRRLERQGYQGILKQGLEPLGDVSREKLQALAPETDMDHVLLLSRDEPPPADAFWWLVSGAVAAPVGLGLMTLSFWLAWRAVHRLLNSRSIPSEVVPT